jgi:hypothetical protein
MTRVRLKCSTRNKVTTLCSHLGRVDVLRVDGVEEGLPLVSALATPMDSASIVADTFATPASAVDHAIPPALT